ncbi:MAG: CBS domain-containing protein [Pseudomonadales bacterium]
MATTVNDLMHTNVVKLDSTASVLDAARHMRDASIGDVLVMDDGKLRGIVTDRDLVVRCLATQGDPGATKLADVCSEDLVTLSPADDFQDAVQLMNDHAVRRLPVVDGNEVVGIISLGDLSVAQDRESALGGISAAPPNQ